MADTNIEWADKVWSPVVGCTKVSAGCANCYAERMAVRQAGMARANIMGCGTCGGRTYRGGGRRANYLDVITDGRWNGKVVCDESALDIPLHWKTPRTIFVCSMSDLFHPGVTVEFIDKVFAIMRIANQHQYMILSKRPEIMAEYMADHPDNDSVWERTTRAIYAMNDAGLVPKRIKSVQISSSWPPPNVLFGTSCEDQPTADERIRHLLRCPAAGLFLSLEPLLGPIKLPLFTDSGEDMPPDERREWGLPTTIIQSYGAPPGTKIDQILIGGESGPDARPCNIEWIRSLIGQAKAAGVPCFFKQGGSWLAKQEGWKHPKGGEPSEWDADLRVRENAAVQENTHV